MILLIDNYDSFTYNLVQRLGELDPSLDLEVHRNDKITLEEMLDKGRAPGSLQEKAIAKISGARGKMKKKANDAQKELEDLGPILKT